MEETQLCSVEVLNAINRAEVDMQVATAKQYPRNIKNALDQIELLATIDQETAVECFYETERGGDTIDGVSVRLAEIIAHSWGNLRVQTRIIKRDDKVVVAQGMCHDLETNVAVSTEVERSIVTRAGATYSDSMITVTANAASAIAFRNAVLKVVPKAITKTVTDKIKYKALKGMSDLETAKNKMLDTYKEIGVEKSQVLQYLKVPEKDITASHILRGRALYVAIKEGAADKDVVFATISSRKETMKNNKNNTQPAMP